MIYIIQENIFNSSVFLKKKIKLKSGQNKLETFSACEVVLIA